MSDALRGGDLRARGSVVRLGATSIATAASEYGVFLGLVAGAGAHYAVGSVAAGLFGILLQFLLNKAFVFRGAGGSTRGQLARHVAVTLCGIGLGAAVLALLVDALGIPYWAAWAMQNLAVFFAWTVPANRRIVFRGPPEMQDRNLSARRRSSTT